MIIKFPDDQIIIDDHFAFAMEDLKQVAFDLYLANRTEVLTDEAQILEIRAWLFRN